MTKKKQHLAQKPMTAYDALKQLFRERPGARIHAGDVNALVGRELTRQATYKAVRQLQQDGYRIISYRGQRGGYELKGRRYVADR